jgi:hypothetical protein
MPGGEAGERVNARVDALRERATGAPENDGPSELRRDATRLWAALGLVVTIWLAAAGRWIISDTVVPWDSKNQFYAFFRFLASAIHSGASPFWNPYHYGGHPAVADPQSLIFAPLFVLWALVDEAPSLRAFDLLVYAHLLIGGLAMAAIGMRARWPIAACVMAAAIFMFGGAAAGRLQHTGIIVSYGFFPLALLLLQLALERRSPAIAAAFAVVASALFLGRNQVALLLSAVLVAVAIASVAVAEQPLRYLRSRAGVFVTIAIIGFALVAVPVLLTLQFAALSNRPEIPLDDALKGSLYPATLAQLMVADIFGSHAQYFGPGWQTIPDLAYTDDSFNYIFVGSIPILLLLWFGFAGGGAFRRGSRWVTAVLVAALLYALGRYTPAFSWAFEWVPGIDEFRRPVDANFVFVAALALLAGHLLADYVRAGMPRQRLTANLAAGGCALAMLGLGILFLERSGHIGFGLFEIVKTAPLPIGVIAMIASARTPRARTVVAAIVAMLAVADLMWWNVAFRLNAQSRSEYAALDHPDLADTEVLNVLDRAIDERRKAGERPRIEVVGLGGPWQNLAMVRGFEATNGYNPLRIGAYDRLVSPGEANWLIGMREFPPSFDSYDCALARALGLEFVVLDRPIEEVPHLARRPVADLLMPGPKAWIYRLRDPSPRIEFTRRIEVADTDATGAGGQLRASPSPDRVLIDDETPPLHRYDLTAGSISAGRARMVAWRPDRVEIETDSMLGGLLALHDIWYPGWVAEIDGVRAPILRADVLFRALETPPGQHRVIFRFAPFEIANLRAALKLVLHGRDSEGEFIGRNHD